MKFRSQRDTLENVRWVVATLIAVGCSHPRPPPRTAPTTRVDAPPRGEASPEMDAPRASGVDAIDQAARGYRKFIAMAGNDPELTEAVKIACERLASILEPYSGCYRAQDQPCAPLPARCSPKPDEPRVSE